MENGTRTRITQNGAENRDLVWIAVVTQEILLGSVKRHRLICIAGSCNLVWPHTNAVGASDRWLDLRDSR